MKSYAMWVNGACLSVIAGILLMVGGCSSGGDSGGVPPPPPPSVTLTIAKAGNGTGTIMSTPAGINCGTTCTLTVTSGTVVTLTATPAPNNTLADWGGACQAGSATCAVTVTSNQTITATFTISSANPALTVTPAGSGVGTVTCNGAACSTSYPWGTSVTLSGVPQAGSSFVGWSGGGCTGTADCTLLLWGDTTVSATFNTLPVTAQLSVTKNGTGLGTVTSNLAGINCGGTCSANFSGGTAVRLTATSTVGSTFAGWSGGGCSGTGTCDVTLNANISVAATFNIAPVNASLAVTMSGTGTGSVTCNGAPCNSSYPSGTVLTIVATPSATSLFSGWGGACGSAGTATTCNLTLTANSTISAGFNLPTLSVVLAGTGSVTSNPTGINCGTTCTASFNKGTAITLTASGVNFSGWTGGGCSGTGACVVSLNQHTTVTATFGGGGVSGSSRYHFIMKPNGPLMAVDPTAPSATPATVASVVSQSGSVYRFTWDAATTSFPDSQHMYQVYASNGRLWRVNASTSSGAPGSVGNLPVQISNESVATQVCTISGLEDASSPNTRRLFYELPGVDSQCGGVFGGTNTDNITKFVSLSDGASVPPTILPTGMSVQAAGGLIYDLSTGIATHVFLVNAANSNTVSIMNLSTNVITPIQANIGDLSVSLQDTSNRVFVHSLATNTLYLYTVSSNTLTPLVTGVSFEAGGTSDGTNFFVANYATGVVYRVPLTATAAGQVTPILTVGGPISGHVTTANRVYAVVPVGATDAKVVSGPKSGGTLRQDVAPAPGQILPQASSSLFYYTRTTLSATLPLTVTSAITAAVNESGTTVATFPNAAQVGIVGPQAYNLRQPRNGSVKLLLATYVSGALNGGTVTAVDGATGVTTATVGTVPPTVPNVDLMFFVGTTDSATLGSGLSYTDPTNNNVFFMDVAIPNSLVHVPVATGSWEIFE